MALATCPPFGDDQGAMGHRDLDGGGEAEDIDHHESSNVIGCLQDW